MTSWRRSDCGAGPTIAPAGTLQLCGDVKRLAYMENGERGGLAKSPAGALRRIVARPTFCHEHASRLRRALRVDLISHSINRFSHT
jgi:hypothetical protein